MKLSFSFLSAALLIPFSEATVSLTERWTIGNVTATSPGNFSYAGMSKTWLETLDPNVSPGQPNSVSRVTFYNGDCKVEGSGAGQGDNTPYYAVYGFGASFLSPTLGAGGASAFDTTSLSWGGVDPDNASKDILDLSFNDNPRVMTDLTVFSSEKLDDGRTITFPEGTLKYCVRLGLYDGFNDDEINFYESVVTLNITMNGTFEILSVGVAPKAQGESVASQALGFDAALCTAEQGQAPKVDGNFNQGAAIKVCLELDAEAKGNGVIVEKVDYFTWTRSDVTGGQVAIVDGAEASNGLTLLDPIVNNVTVGTPEVVITSVLFAKFYQSAGLVSASGKITMIFPGDAAANATGSDDAARRLDGNNRLLGGNNNNENRRNLQDGGSEEDEGGFEVSASLNKADDGPVAIQQTAAAGAGTSITVVATIVGLVSAILLA